MELKSLAYVVFGLIVAIIYFLLANRKVLQRYFLLLTGLFFAYKMCGIVSTCAIVVLALLIYVIGRCLEKQVSAGSKGKAAFFLYLGLCLDIGLLLYVKFFSATYDLLVSFFSAKGVTIAAFVAPIGLSYYALSLAAYLLDLYHKKISAETDFSVFLLFVTFFPAIIQGPINLYKNLTPQLKEAHHFDWDRFVSGCQRMLWGYLKKAVIADRIGIFVIAVLQDESVGGIVLFYTMMLYSFQIYADFSGGIDVIMGLSEILGIRLAENFKAPLVSKSITEYWKRWHMSLGEFMEKYIYYPLVLNRKTNALSKKFRHKYLQKVFAATFASVVVFVIVGIWHGTGWNYVVYGCYQAFFVSTAILLGPVYKKVRVWLKVDEKCITWRIFVTVRTFLLLTVGRYFIRAKDLTQTWELFLRTLRGGQVHALFDGGLLQYGLDEKNLIVMYLGILLMIAVDLMHHKGIRIRQTIMKQDIVFRYVLYFAVIFAIAIFGIYGKGFSSASFIYQGF